MNNSGVHTFLALGDSYTIGESVPREENFPNQTIQLLQKEEIDFDSPLIIAKTGWTTDELNEAIKKQSISEAFDIVTLLIGVNNQYRGRSVEEYHSEFESVLKQAISLANGKIERVIVLSIPDWSVTPFAEGRERNKIAAEIDAYNRSNKTISEQFNIYYIDITAGTKEAAADSSLLADDGLHPSGKEYKRWAEKIAVRIKEVLK